MSSGSPSKCDFRRRERSAAKARNAEGEAERRDSVRCGGRSCAPHGAQRRPEHLALSEREQAEFEPLRLVHDYARSWERLGARPPGSFTSPPVRHALVRRHPETGERGLYLSDHAYAVEGWPAAEGRVLIERLLALCTRPDRVYRHRWRAGDVLFWDNRNMLHRAQGFDETQLRVMFHVRVAGSARTED